eukprot:2842224-Lingulodinium_polyedra.AAC.1
MLSPKKALGWPSGGGLAGCQRASASTRPGTAGCWPFSMLASGIRSTRTWPTPHSGLAAHRQSPSRPPRTPAVRRRRQRVRQQQQSPRWQPRHQQPAA